MLTLQQASAGYYDQNFDTWPAKITLGSYTNEGWVAKDCLVYGIGVYLAASPTNAIWLDYMQTDRGEPGPPSITSPPLSNGIGTVTIATRNRTAGTNVFAVKTSPDGISWVTNSIFSNIYNAVYTTNAFLIDVYGTNYFRLKKLSDTGGTTIYLGVDDVSISIPSSRVIFSNPVMSPTAPQTESSTAFSINATPDAHASNLTLSVYFSTNQWSSRTITPMTNAGSGLFIMSTNFPAIEIPGTRVDYYVMARFTGVYNSNPTNYWPATAPATGSYFVVRQRPFQCTYTNLSVKDSGSFSNAMTLTGDNAWQLVTTNLNLVTPTFRFSSGSQNWRDADQPSTTLPIAGYADAGGSGIDVSTTITNHLAFSFDETNLSYSVQNCAYCNFSGFGAGATNTGNYSDGEGWSIYNGRINRSDETNLAFNGNFGILKHRSGIAGYSYRRLLTVSSNSVGKVSLTNFPLLVSIATNSLKSVANGGKVINNNGNDILFTDIAETNILSHEIELYNPTNGILVAWVCAPLLSRDEDNSFYMFYGNASVTNSQQNIPGTWNPDFKAVWHCNNHLLDSRVYDSTTNAYHGTVNAMSPDSQVSGQLAGSFDFNPVNTNEYVTLDSTIDLPASSAFTISAWINPRYPDYYNGVVCGTNGNSETIRITPTGQPSLRINAANYDGSTAITTNGSIWSFLSVTRAVDGSTRMYCDGIDVSGSWNTTSAFNIKHLGRGEVSDIRNWRGYLDEIRVSTSANHSNWVFACYSNQVAPAAFVTTAAEEDMSAIKMYVQSPNLTNGVGTVTFWYRNHDSTGIKPAGFTLQKSSDGTNWLNVSEVTDILSVDYLHFTGNIGNMNIPYVRIVNNTSGSGTNSTLCIDDLAITDPGDSVDLSNPARNPDTPDNGVPVTVSIDVTPMGGATNMQCYVYFRPSTSQNFDYREMNLSGSTFTGIIPPMAAGGVDYYFVCVYDGFNVGPAYYPELAPQSFLTYTNGSELPAYRQQDFATFMSTITLGSYTNNEWVVKDSIIYSAGSYYAASTPNCAWLNYTTNANQGQPGNPWVVTPLLTNGVGTIYFNSRCRVLGSNFMSVAYSSNGNDWTTNNLLTNTINASWTPFSAQLNFFGDFYACIEKTGDDGQNLQWLGIDDVVASFPPADVIITNIGYSPGYPAASQDVTVRATIYTANTNFLAFSLAPKLCYSNNNSGSSWYTNGMTHLGSNVYVGTIPAAPAGTVQYFVRCDFDGYYYTNGAYSEKMSPSFAPDAPSTLEMPQSTFSYPVRSFISDYGSMSITGSFGNLSMSLYGDNVWQGVYAYDQTNSVISILFNAFDQAGSYSYTTGTNTWGDSEQVEFGLPQAAMGQLDGSNIVANIDTQFVGKIIFRFNTQNNMYYIIRGAFQDFNDWRASADYFETSMDIAGITVLTNNFNSWPTNITYVTVSNQDLEDYQSWLTDYYTGLGKPWWPDPTWGADCGPFGSNPNYSNGWYIADAIITQEQTIVGGAINQACFLRDDITYGKTWPRRETTTEGLGTFSFDYRVVQSMNYVYNTVYTNGYSWNNYRFDFDLVSNEESPGNPYVAAAMKYVDANNYYECRLAKRNATQLNLQFWRKRHGAWARLAESSWFTASLYDPTTIQLYAATNNGQSVHLEACYGSIYPTLLFYDTTTNAIFSPGTVALDSQEAGMQVDNAVVTLSDIQRFAYWVATPTNDTYGNFTNNGWVLYRGAAFNSSGPNDGAFPGYGRLSSNVSASSVQNFEGWSAPTWGTYTNNSWIISNALIAATNGSYSLTNALWLRNDTTYTNSYVRTSYLPDGLESLSFHGANYGTNSIQLQVQISPNGTNWQTHSTLTSTNTSFPYTRKARIRFKAYNKNETLSDFPALVVLSTNITGFSYSSFTSTNGYDLRFTDSTQTRELNYEIEKWDNNSFTPKDFPGLSIWLKSDVGLSTSGVSVTSWADQSGNGRNASQGTSGYRPTVVYSAVNGLPAVRFDGSDDYLSFSDTPALTIFVVNRVLSGSKNLAGIIGRYNQDQGIRRNDPENGAWRHAGSAGDFTNPSGSLFTVNGVDTRTSATNLWHIMGTKRNSSLMYMNRLGWYYSGRQWKGDITEVIIYNRQLNELEFNRVGEYLAKKYAITTQFPEAGLSYIWVQVPALSGTNSSIWAHWGGTGLTNPPAYSTNGSAWADTYNGVWHLATTNGTDYYADSTKKRGNGTKTGTTVVQGYIGEGVNFNGTSDKVLVGSVGVEAGAKRTMSGWVKPDSTSITDYTSMFGLQGDAEGNYRYFDVEEAGGSYRLHTYGVDYVFSTVTTNWQYLTATYTGTSIVQYVNGVLVRTTANANLNSDDKFVMGVRLANNRYFKGRLDELRVESTDMSSNWIWATWYNQADNAAFCEYGTVSNVSASVIPWNLFNVSINSNNTRYARIYMSQLLQSGMMLGLDDITASTPSIPSLTSPYLAYAPTQIRFDYYIDANASRNADGYPTTIRIRASEDGTSWDTVVPPFSARPGGWYQSYFSPPNLDLSKYHYLRIENVSPSNWMSFDNVYISGTTLYTETFPSDPPAKWYSAESCWRVRNSKYTRAGYPAGTLTFGVETNYNTTEPDFPPEINWPLYQTISATNLAYKHQTCNIQFWDYIYPRIRHYNGVGHLVLDNLTMTSWKAGNVSADGWYGEGAWVANNPTNPVDRVLQFWKNRVGPGSNMFICTPFLTNGVGTISFDVKIENPPVVMRVKHTDAPPLTNSWNLLDPVTFTTAGWDSYSVTITNSWDMYVQIVNESTTPSAILTIDNIEISDYMERTNTMWVAENALISHYQGGLKTSTAIRAYQPYYEPLTDVKTCYLNNDPHEGCRTTVYYTNNMPYVQSPFLPNGIGEVSFWYRNWDESGTNTAALHLFVTDNEAKSPTNWAYVTSILGITNRTYQYFTTNLFYETNYVLRIYSETNQSARVCLDDIFIAEPVSANLRIDSFSIDPELPLYTNQVHATVNLKNFIFSPTNIAVWLYYSTGTNDWGYPNTPIPVDVILSNSPFARTLRTSTPIPQFPIDTVVQYYIYCTFDGMFAENVTPKISRQFTNPPWYYPIDLNAGKSVTNPYYFVFSCSTGASWINEINIWDPWFEQTNQYVEICGRTGSILSNWWLEVLNPSFITNGLYYINNNAVLPYDNTNGFGFWLLACNGVANADMFLTNALPEEGGVRLRRSMGAYEHAVCFGQSGAGQGEAMTNDVSQRFIYAGWDSSINEIEMPLSLSLGGSGSNVYSFTWIATNPSPSVVNFGQDLQYNAPPPEVSITITNMWVTATNICLAFVSTGTEDVHPSPWYSTNLMQTNWYQIGAFSNTYNPVSGVYTQWFSTLTTNRTYYYKIVFTNN